MPRPAQADLSAVLPAWNDSATKKAIADFVARVTREGSPDFVEPRARIAVFDNDGTLWCEKPLPIQAGFLLERFGEQAALNPALRAKQPWKSAFEKDHEWLANVITKHYLGDDTDLKLMSRGLLQAYAGESVDEFAAKAEQFLRSSSNPALHRKYLETVYAPMIELLRYLTANGFTNYIVSGGSRDFMRPVTQELYGIPPEHVVGTTVALEYRVENGVGNIYHKPELDVFDDGPTKVVRIWSRIGARPLFAAGNSNGDIQMLEFAAQHPQRGFVLLVDHDDNKRDIAYSAGAEKAVLAAKAHRWTVASVKEDWRTVFA
jgi:phosphoserine phosphatase